MAIQLAVLYSPLDSVINGGLSHIELADWGYMALVSCTIFIIVESKKMLFKAAAPMRIDKSWPLLEKILTWPERK
jgi:hypothetical protein